MDHVDGHDNTPPFICLTLSKHFGYSNPSPDHIIGCSDAYKAGVFTWTDPKDPSVTLSFGSGSRGDLKAVSASILLSRDALSPTLDNDPSNGGLKEPLHKLMQIIRGLEFIRSPSHRRTERLIAKNAQDAIGQVPYVSLCVLIHLNLFRVHFESNHVLSYLFQLICRAFPTNLPSFLQIIRRQERTSNPLLSLLKQSC